MHADVVDDVECELVCCHLAMYVYATWHICGEHH